MVLFERFLFNRQLINNIWHHGLHWKTPSHWYMIVFSWSTIKGDWWKHGNDEQAKFFSWDWKDDRDGLVLTGIFIGRFALVYQTSE